MSQKLDELKVAASALDPTEQEELLRFLMATIGSSPTIDWRQEDVETNKARQHLAEAIASYRATLKNAAVSAESGDSAEWDQILEDLDGNK